MLPLQISPPVPQSVAVQQLPVKQAPPQQSSPLVQSAVVTQLEQLLWLQLLLEQSLF